ncbi:aminopeptidase [Adlercreutzia sp. R7]|uniref:Aminopeptidase n=1 Tax=Adlercreutzia wanghongyangiae TaxID=3111451 RepID=A0ABU6IFH7_9ACTN|nr:aminopeptidase [Adlercreutzia sp. R7]
MADLNEHVAYLSQEIGPRPAGTEEEQRAALYISETLSSTTGLPTTMEDFQCNPDSSLPRALCSGVVVVATLIATIFSVVTIPAIIIALVCAALMAAEIVGKPVLSRFLNRGVSQNVVAQYVPLKSTTRASRRRKVILVANYDSGKVRRDLNNAVISLLPVLYWIEFGLLVLLPVLLLIRFIMAPQDGALIAFNVILGAGMIVAVLPVVSFIFERVAAYNEGANCNASGVALMMEVAARVAAARDLPDAEEGLIHGEEAARSAGLVPEGAELVYDASASGSLGASMESASQRLAAAKAAVAALSGQPAADNGDSPAEGSEGSASEESVAASSEAPDLAPAAVPVPVPAEPASVPTPEPPAPQEHSVPDWFKKGQQQAKKPTVEKPIQRSRYAAALATAEEEIAAREEAQKAAADELSERMRGMRASVQAASEAAGATPTGVIPDAAVQAASQSAALEPVARPTAEPVGAVPVDGDALVSVAAASAGEVPPVEESVTPVSPAAPVAPAVGNPAAAPVAPVAAPAPVPAVAAPAVVDDDPNISLREGQRPLTGTPAAALDGVPNPLDAAPAASGRRLVIPEVEAAAPQAAPASASPVASAQPKPRKRRAISLPNIGVSQELPRISMDDHLQAAPLSEERPAHDGRVRDLSAVVPSVAAAPAVPPAPSAESALRSALPSLGGTPPQTDPGLSGSISLAGSFSSMGATGAAAPIGDELLDAAAPDELYVEDVDDSAYVEQVTETGAIAGPGYVEMPKSRFGRIFGKLRHKGKEEEITPQQWLNVEDDFEAQEVGAARGSWESFREDDSYEAMGQTTAFTPDYFDEAFDDEAAGEASGRHRLGRPYEGGAFSRGGRHEDDELIEDEEFAEENRPRKRSAFADGLPADFVFDTDQATQHIEQFHSQRVDIEVWFVALGSELAGNGGMKAFMETHAAEMKGSIIIDVQAMGAGELTLIDKEGTYLSKKASSRMKRLVKKAGQAVGLSVPTGTMTWMDSSSAYALKHGQQALHLAGMDGKKPAFFAQADDVVENIDQDQLSLNADFVMELLKQI